MHFWIIIALFFLAHQRLLDVLMAGMSYTTEGGPDQKPEVWLLATVLRLPSCVTSADILGLRLLSMKQEL